MLLRNTSSTTVLSPPDQSPLSAGGCHRVWGLTVKSAKGNTLVRVRQWEALWKALDVCAHIETKYNTTYTPISKQQPMNSGSIDDGGRPASSRVRIGADSGGGALQLLDIDFYVEVSSMPYQKPIVVPLTTTPTYVAASLVSSLQVLRIKGNRHDESTINTTTTIPSSSSLASAATMHTTATGGSTTTAPARAASTTSTMKTTMGFLLAAAAPHLQELCFSHSGLSTVQALIPLAYDDSISSSTSSSPSSGTSTSGSSTGVTGAPHPHPIPSSPLIRRLTLSHCNQLTSLEGLQTLTQLEVIDISCSANISSLRPLAQCPYLKILSLHHCTGLTSLQGLEHHEYLAEIDASYTRIASIAELARSGGRSGSRSGCGGALTHVNLASCRLLTSIDALQGHAQLSALNLTWTAVDSIRVLLNCSPLLKTISVSNCGQLESLDGLQNHAYLEEVDASGSAITSLQALLQCKALKKVDVDWCDGLTSLDGLQEHALLETVLASGVPLSSVRELEGESCPALKKVDLSNCQRLPMTLLFQEGCSFAIDVQLIR